MGADIHIIVADPRFTRREISSICPPMSAVKADDCEERVVNFVERQDARVGDSAIHRSDMKRQDLREGRHQKLLSASFLGTLLTLPIFDRHRSTCVYNCL